MTRLRELQAALFSMVACVASAQQPASTVQPAPPAPRLGIEEGFFRPAEDPALTRFPDPSESPSDAQALPSDAAVAAAEAQRREAQERDLDRVQREQARATADLARRAPPLITSPLDGTAPIVSPLDR